MTDRLPEDLRRELRRADIVSICGVLITARFCLFILQGNGIAAWICSVPWLLLVLVLIPWQNEIKRKRDIEKKWRR